MCFFQHVLQQDVFFSTRALARCVLATQLLFYNTCFQQHVLLLCFMFLLVTYTNTRSLHFAEYEILTGETSKNQSSRYFLFGSVIGNIIYCPNCSTHKTRGFPPQYLQKNHLIDLFLTCSATISGRGTSSPIYRPTCMPCMQGSVYARRVCRVPHLCQIRSMHGQELTQTHAQESQRQPLSMRLTWVTRWVIFVPSPAIRITLAPSLEPRRRSDQVYQVQCQHSIEVTRPGGPELVQFIFCTNLGSSRCPQLMLYHPSSTPSSLNVVHFH